MKHTNLSLAGVVFGLFITGSAAVRYFVLYSDIDKGIFFVLIGLIIVAVSWNYAGRIQLYENIKKLRNTLTDLEQWAVDNKK